MTKINVFLNRQTLRILIRQDSRICRLRLADHGLGTRLIEENVVDYATPPGVYAVCAADTAFTDEGVATTVVVGSVVVGAVVIFLFEGLELGIL